MASLDSIVDVQISKETATVSRVGFGTPATLTYHTVFPEFARTYGSLSEMVSDGFTTSSREYKMAAAVFAQNPRPRSIVIGRRANAPRRTVDLTPKSPVLPLTAYDIEINGETMAYTTDATPTVAEITLGLTTDINTGTQNVLATDGTTKVTIVSADAPGGSAADDVPFLVDFDPSLWEIKDVGVDPTPGIDDDLADLILANDDWYGLVADAHSPSEISALAAAIEAAASPKIYIADSQDSDIIKTGSSDIASTLKTAAYDRTGLIYHPSADPSAAASWLGRQLPTDPGSTTWMFKRLTGVATYSLTTGEQGFIDGKNGNHYQTVADAPITATGKMASGEFIDVTRFVDWLTARIKENVFRVLTINPKIPYTNLGIQTIANEVEGVLKNGATQGGIDGEQAIIVEAPLAEDVDANDKASRLLPDVTFIATLAGAVHKVEIRGTVTV